MAPSPLGACFAGPGPTAGDNPRRRRAHGGLGAHPHRPDRTRGKEVAGSPAHCSRRSRPAAGLRRLRSSAIAHPSGPSRPRSALRKLSQRLRISLPRTRPSLLTRMSLRRPSSGRSACTSKCTAPASMSAPIRRSASPLGDGDDTAGRDARRCASFTGSGRAIGVSPGRYSRQEVCWTGTRRCPGQQRRRGRLVRRRRGRSARRRRWLPRPAGGLRAHRVRRLARGQRGQGYAAVGPGSGGTPASTRTRRSSPAGRIAVERSCSTTQGTSWRTAWAPTPAKCSPTSWPSTVTA